MTVLITGASGFVGLNVAEAVLAAGTDAVLFDAQPIPDFARPALAIHPGRFHEATGDVRDAALLDGVLGDFAVERVFHGAAVTGAYERERNDAAGILEVNIMGTAAVLEAARLHRVRRFLYPSSVTVYGESLYGYARMDEDTTPAVPDGLYGISKYAGERLSLRFRALWGMDVVCARIGVVFGPWERDTGYRDTLSPYFQIARLAARGEDAVLPPVRHRRDWIYSRDAARALVSLLFAEDLAHQVYNVASGEAADDSPLFCEKLAAGFPDFTWRIADGAGEANIVYHGQGERHPQSITRLAEAFGTGPGFSVAEAFDDYVAWMGRTKAMT